jgi:tRNA-dihydrouridine synthase
MIGRGALARPYLFRALRGEALGAREGLASYCAVLRQYEQLLESAGFSAAGRLSRLKQWLSIARTFAPAVLPVFERIKRCAEVDDAIDRLAEERTRAESMQRAGVLSVATA